MTLSVKHAALLALIGMGLELGLVGNLRAQSSSPRGPAVVEIYTSQGCSSCPPADALLGELSQMPNVVALAFHVDYWNSIGWRDHFALPIAVERQHRYVETLGLSSAFTPQVVVDARSSFVGSDVRRILAAIAEPLNAEGSPAVGDPAIGYQWQGATWLFSTAARRETFVADPARYAPQYGGYCAFAVSRGTTADADPGQWAIVDGKLYVNNNAFAKKLWDQDRPGNIEAGDSNWPLIPKHPVGSASASADPQSAPDTSSAPAAGLQSLQPKKAIGP